ncbi:MAG TPA: ABC transporter ATP-binding protein [Beutenbergiaceae bacterium]|nr:ABC transporter ATP-binding protein [Beutenbergiaceae bacterium]
MHVAPGELLTVVGPSGCGKSTLLRTIAGFETPNSGTIRIGHTHVFGPSAMVRAHERGVGVVPQEGALFPHLNVARNVGFGLGHLPRRQRRSVVEQTLELVGLEGLGSRRPHQLSGGQQQRVALARAIAPSPRLILLDEPFSALDEYLRESLRHEVQTLLKTLGSTAVLVTHDQEEALALGDRVAVMRDGQVIQVGSPKETYFTPQDLDLARFLGEVVVLNGQVSPAQHEGCTGALTCRARGAGQCAGPPEVSCAFGTLPVGSYHGRPGLCDVLIRPENIQVHPAHEPASTGLVGTVVESTFYGHDGMLKVQVPEVHHPIHVRVVGDHDYDVGARVRLVVNRPVSTYAA